MINLSELLVGKTDETLNGISNYIKSKANNLAQGFARNFSFSNEEKMTFINDVHIDLCFNISDNNTNSTPTHNLDNGVIISETIKKQPTIWTLDCKLTSYDHKEKYEKLLKMNLVTLMFAGEVKENLVIMSINRKITNTYYTDFTITLAKLNFVQIKTIPAPSFKKITAKTVETITGKKETDKVSPFKSGDKVGVLTVTETIGDIQTVEAKVINVINPFDIGRSGGGAF